jgi:putative ABC transport system permease protein
MLQSLAYDLKFSGRMLRKNPVMTAVAIIIIALGTGAVSTIFSIANAIALRPLPDVARASELIVPERLKPNGETISASYVYYRHLATNARSVNLAAWSAVPLTVSTGGEAVAPLGNIVSGNYFDVLGVRPALGRFFVGDEVTVPNTYPVIVISYDFWQRQFSGDSTAIGRTVLVNGSRFTVVGVAPPHFTGLYPVLRTVRLDRAPEPFMFLPIAQHWRANTNLVVRATGDPAAIFAAIRHEIHTLDPNLPVPVVTTLSQATSVMLLPQRVAVAVTGVLGLIGLLLAAVGLYGVLSFSVVQRSAEIGIRLALGAMRRDVLRLVVGEGMRLVAMGMTLGLALAMLATRAMRPFLFGVSPIDPATFAVIALTLAGAALLASYLPARRAAAADPASSLRRG